MKKTCLLFGLFLVATLTVAGSASGAMARESGDLKDSLEEIVKIPDPFMRMEALQGYLRRSRDQNPPGQEVDKHLFLHLTDTAFRTRAFSLVLKYGEQALNRNWNNPRIKMALYFYVARSCEELGVNVEKALHYARFLQELARVVDPSGSDSAIWVRFVAPAQRMSMRLISAEADDAEEWARALSAGINAFALDPSETAAGELYEAARRAELHAPGGKAALDALEALCRSDLVRPEYLNRLAFWYSRRDNKVRAARLLIRSYGMRKDPAVAYTIGKLLQNSRPEEAMKFLAESAQSGNEQVSTRARRLLEHLVFNAGFDGLSNAQREQRYKALLNDAKERLKKGNSEGSG